MEGYEEEIDEWELMYGNDMAAAEELEQETEEIHLPESVCVQQPVKKKSVEEILRNCANLLGEEYEETESVGGMDVDSLHSNSITSSSTLSGGKTKTTFALFDTEKDNPYLHKVRTAEHSLPITLTNGKRYYLTKKNALLQNSLLTKEESKKAKTSPTVLLKTSVEDMIKQLEQVQIEEAVENEKKNSNGSGTEFDSNGVLNSSLWLDLYEPKCFIDLLSDERINRDVLHWVKGWDAVVFPNKLTSLSSFNNDTGNSRCTMVTKSSNCIEDPNDPRPFEKVLLICGPPGAGKTTLANIIARHAGYNPIEVNASDERTPNALKEKIISSMEMRSVFGERKPNCIILDEIDGALNGGEGRNSISAIMEIVQTPFKRPQSNKKKQHHPLKRPLILICNDLYAPVLRSIRKIAKIFVLNSLNQRRLIQRLKHICRNEELKVTTGVLSVLCERAKNDIRFCLNLLQMARVRTKHLTMHILDEVLGSKDLSNDVRDSWDAVFYENKALGPTVKQTSSFTTTLEIVQNVGNYELMLSGLHENLYPMMFNDPTLKKTSEVLEWMEFSDYCDTRVRRTQDYAFQSYIPFAAIATRSTCCTSSKRRIVFPTMFFEHRKAKNECLNVVNTFMDGARLSLGIRSSVGVLILDVISWLISILSPPIKNINPSLQTTRDKQQISSLIYLLAQLGLSYKLRYGVNGLREFNLDPDLRILISYKHGQCEQYSAELSQAAKEMINREVELENMRRAEKQEMRLSDKNDSDRKALSTVNSSAIDKAMQVVESPKDLQDKDRHISEESKVTLIASNLNDRWSEEALRRRNPYAHAFKESKKRKLQKEFGENLQNGPSIRFKYNEGYTCGIKRSVYIRDFF